MINSNTPSFGSGLQNRYDPENIAQDAAADSLNWLTVDGNIELARGRALYGPGGVAGSINKIHFGYKVNGTQILFRRTATKCQYYNGTTYVDIITGLGPTDVYSFANYSSLSGSFVWFCGKNGMYKIDTINPASFNLFPPSGSSVYGGNAIIDKGRTLMWNVQALSSDPTGLYISNIDKQSVYTLTTNEVLFTGNGVTTSFSGILATKGATKRTFFGISFNQSIGVITAIDNQIGIITGTGISGTINYSTGAWTLVFTVAPTAGAGTNRFTYTYEDSALSGIANFSFSAIRLAGEGTILRQDEGGDAIQTVIVGIDGNYYSFKSNSVYQLTMSDNDLTFSNIIYRKDIGVPGPNAVVATNAGLVFLNTGNISQPKLTILQKNPVGNTVLPVDLLPLFKWENYFYDTDTIVTTWNRYVLVACKSNSTKLFNDRLILCDLTNIIADVCNYPCKSLAKSLGVLYAGAATEESVYKMFYGFDDLGTSITNYWVGREDRYDITNPTIAENLKKFSWLRIEGSMARNQYFEVSIGTDDGPPQLIGTVRGNGNYVLLTDSSKIGVDGVGIISVGGTLLETDIYEYLLEFKVKTSKFRKRQLQFVAKGIGYMNVGLVVDKDIWVYEQRLPKKNRVRQNWSLNGLVTDQSNPTF